MVNNLARSILVIDDDPAFRAIMVSQFNAGGLEVVEANSGEEANSVLNLGNPLLAIVDYRLPEMDGMTWIMQARESGRNFPIVFVTGVWLDERTFNWLRNILRVALILRKPIVPELFVQQIESLLPADVVSQPPVPRPSWPALGSNESHQRAIAEIDMKIEATEADAEDLEGLRKVRTKLEREDRLAQARVDYVKELAQSWQELSKAVSQAQQEVDNTALRAEAIAAAHKIRGTAGSMGFARVGQSAGKVEDLIRGLDPTGTLQEVMWTEIFRALVDGETCVREVIESLNESGEKPEQSEHLMVSKVLILGKEEDYRPKISGLNTSAPVEFEYTESPAGCLQKSKRMQFDAAILDLDGVGRGKILEINKEIREIPGHSALPIAFVCGEAQQLSTVDLLFCGASATISRDADQPEMARVLDTLLVHRHQQMPRILTVDDDEVLTKFTATVLGAEQMLVKALNKPIQIMEVIEEFKPDLVLLDVIMPGLSGYDVCRMLRGSESWKDVPILFLTSKSDQDGRAAAFQAGGNDFLSKPVLAEELITRVKSQLHMAEVKRGGPDKDPVTGALTGADFISELADMVKNAKDKDRAVSVCLLTLEDFMKVSLAHSWDSALAAMGMLGKLVHSRFRAEDLRGRLREDMLGIAFLGQEMETVSDAMARLLEEFSDIKVSSPVTGHFKTMFTAGLAEFPGDGDTAEALIDMANQRLLAFKLERRGVTTGFFQK